MEGVKGLAISTGQVYQAVKVDNDQKVNEIAGKLLGKKGGEGYSSLYDPSLLVAIPRILNREIYNIDEDNLPFEGFDVWNGYEVTCLTENGLPVTGVMKIVIPANSHYHPESKSIKMYVNSFAMTKAPFKSQRECLDWIEYIVKDDLDRLCECEVQVRIFTSAEEEKEATNSMYTSGNYENIDYLPGIDEIEFSEYNMNPDLLEESKNFRTLMVRSDKLRSACRVTHQPDHGSVYVFMHGDKVPTKDSLLKFIVSFRNEYHFHEEICEAIYTTLQNKFNPESLMVACNYTRRGGWDINPVRASNVQNIPHEWRDVECMLKKTIKQ